MGLSSWRNIDAVRVGMTNHRIKLEVSPEYSARIPEPLAVRVGQDHNGKPEFTFYHSPDGRYHWGETNTEYNYRQVEFFRIHAEYENVQAKHFRFTYTEPYIAEWGKNCLRVVMPAELKPPKGATSNPKKSARPKHSIPELPVDPVAQLPLPTSTETFAQPQLTLQQIEQALNQHVQAGTLRGVSVQNGFYRLNK